MAPSKGRGWADLVDSDHARKLLEYKLLHGHLPETEIFRLMRCDQLLCTETCKPNDKHNVNCLCNIIPAVGCSRKKGLWTKDPGVITQLGRDPRVQRRKVCSNTCSDVDIAPHALTCHPPTLWCETSPWIVQLSFSYPEDIECPSTIIMLATMLFVLLK